MPTPLAPLAPLSAGILMVWAPLLGALFPSPPPEIAHRPDEREREAALAAVHQRAVVVDAHADTVQRILYEGAAFFEGIPQGHLDFAKMRAGGIDGQFFSIFVSPKRVDASNVFPESMRQVKALQDLVAHSGGRLALARFARQVRQNAAAGVGSVLLGVEGGHALGGRTEAAQLANLRRLADEGVRYLTLTWTNSNDIGGSCGDWGDGRGLTAFGRQVIDQMHDSGMLVDLSHASDPLFWDAIRYARKPIILSHSSARGLTNVPRNATDAMLRAVAGNGGAACVNFNPAFLDIDTYHAQQPLWRRYENLPIEETWRHMREDSARLPPVPLARLVDHLMHMIEVAGIEHVCLGSDFDGVPSTPRGMEDASHLPALTAALLGRGLTEQDLDKVLGGNVLRILEANEAR